MNKLIIRKYSYLKTPKYSWSLNNPEGGSFSNSGFHNSEKSCLEHFKIMFPKIEYEIEKIEYQEAI